MRSGKTHSALLEIEKWKEKANSRPREGRAGPTHLTCGVRERNIHTHMAAGLSLSDPLLHFILLLCVSFSPTLASLSQTKRPSCLSLSSPSLSSPLLVLLSARLMSAAMGYFSVISLSCRRTPALAVRVFAAGTEDLLSSESSASQRGSQELHTQLQMLMHSFTLQ